MTASTHPTVDPQRTALLVMDVQNGILGSAPAPDALIDRITSVIADVRAAGGTVAFVRVAFTEEDWAAVPQTNTAFSQLAEAKGMHHEAPAAQIDARVAPEDGDIVVRKTRIGAMSTTDLHEQLTARGIDTLVLTGISTSGVVMSTLVDAVDRDYRVIVVSDAVADQRAEVHDVMVNTVFPSRAHVIDSATLHDLLPAA
jgi:nicotinamidase-related amidase